MGVIWLFVMAGMTVFSNAFIILLYARQRGYKRKPSATLLCSQAVADLLAGAMLVPLAVAQDFREVVPISYLVCFAFFAGLLNRGLIAFDRYAALAKPFKYRTIISEKNVRLMLLATWSTSFGLTIIPISWEYAPQYNKTQAKTLYLAFLLLITFLSITEILSLNALTYLRIRCYFRGKAAMVKGYQNNQILTKTARSVARKLKRASFQFLVLVVLFCAMYIPVIYINIADKVKHDPNYTSNSIQKASLYIFGLYAFVNPAISLWRFRDLKLAAVALLRDFARRFRLENVLKSVKRTTSHSNLGNSSICCSRPALSQTFVT